MKKIILISLLLFTKLSQAQQLREWNGKKCAVVLTYDDAVDQHLDNAIPVLDSLGLKATFYVTAFSPSMQHRLTDWKKITTRGHELGNHTLFHPCLADRPGREFVPADYKLNNYTVKRMLDETKMTNLFLQALDGKKRRTFAFTCGDTNIGDSSLIRLLAPEFVAMRSVRAEMHRLSDVKLEDVDCYMVNGESGDQLIDWVKKATATNSLLVILFHGVGGGNGLDVTLAAHRQLLVYLKKNQKDIWVAPMIEVADHISRLQQH